MEHDLPRMIVVDIQSSQCIDDDLEDLSSSMDEDDYCEGDECFMEQESCEMQRAAVPSRLQAVHVIHTAGGTFHTQRLESPVVSTDQRNNVTPDPSVCTSPPETMMVDATGTDLQFQYQRSLRRLARSMQHSDLTRMFIQQNNLHALLEGDGNTFAGAPSRELLDHRRDMYEWILTNSQGVFM